MDASEKKALKRSSYAIYVSDLAVSAFALITAPLLIKTLTQDEYGSYHIIRSLNSIIVYFISWGLASVFARYIPEFLEKRNARNLLKLTFWGVGIRFVSITLVLGLAWLASDVVFEFFNFTPFLKTYYAAVLLFVFLTKTDEIVGPMILSSYLEQTRLVVIRVLQAIARLCIVLYAVFTDGGLRTLLFGLIAMEGVSVLVCVAISAHLIWSKIRAITDRTDEPFPVRRMARFGAFSFLLATSAVFFDVTIDNFVISHYLGVKQVAPYAFACTLLGMAAALNPVAKLKSLINHVVIRRHTDQKDLRVFEELHRFTTTVTLAFLIPAIAFICTFSQDIIALLNPEYDSAGILFFVMAPFIIARGLLFCYPYPIVALEKVEYRFYACAFSIYNLIADIVLVQLFGLVGIAVATSSAAVFTAIYYHLVVTRILRVPAPYYWRGLKCILVYVAIALGVALAASVTRVGSIWLSAVLFSIVYLALVSRKVPLHVDDQAAVRSLLWKRDG